MTLNLDSAQIEHVENGLTFRPLTMADFGWLQNQVKISDHLKPFIKLQDLIRWCYSAQGIDIALCRSAKVDYQALVTAIPSGISRWVLIDKIIEMTMGTAGEKSEKPAEPPFVESQTK